jgi:VanZ family protein
VGQLGDSGLSRVCVIVFGSAALLELAQFLTPGRHARVSDAVQKMLGGMIGIMFARGLILLQQSKSILTAKVCGY